MKAALLLLCLASCAIPIAGTRCDAGVAYCASLNSALSCQDGTLRTYACTGPKGCQLGNARAVMCDQSVGASAGSPCFPEYEGKGQCAMIAWSTLRCIQGSWVATACPSGTACHADATGVDCR
jgi:hypothetical protein